MLLMMSRRMNRTMMMLITTIEQCLQCSCTPGWRGVYCDTPCPVGRFHITSKAKSWEGEIKQVHQPRWGEECLQKCRCRNGASCHHVTGRKTYKMMAVMVMVLICQGTQNPNAFYAKKICCSLRAMNITSKR